MYYPWHCSKLGVHLKKCGLFPFEVLYGQPPPLIPGQARDLWDYGQIGLHKFLKGLVHGSREIALHLGHLELAPVTLRPLHPWSPGDWVWVKTPITGGQQMGPTGALYLTCSGPSRDRLSNVYGRVPQNWDDCGGPSWSFLRHWSCVDFASPGAWRGCSPSPKGQGVSIQTLSSNLFNMNEWSKAHGAEKVHLFQLTIDEPQ
jgi:hypothetical protein